MLVLELVVGNYLTTALLMSLVLEVVRRVGHLKSSTIAPWLVILIVIVAIFIVLIDHLVVFN